MHSLPAVYLMEAMLPDRIVNDLNEVEIIDQIEDIDLSDLPDLN